MDIRKVGQRFMRVYTKEDGSVFRGLIGKPTMTTGNDSFVVRRQVLLVPPKDDVSPGDMFKSALSKTMLVLDNADEETLGITQKAYYVLTMNKNLSWSRPVKTKDVITLLEKDGEIERLGTFPCRFDVYRQEEDSVLRIPETSYRIITNRELRLNDILDDNYVVKRVEKQLGVTVAYV